MADHMGPPPCGICHHSLVNALVDDRDHHNYTRSKDDIFGDRRKEMQDSMDIRCVETELIEELKKQYFGLI